MPSSAPSSMAPANDADFDSELSRHVGQLRPRFLAAFANRGRQVLEGAAFCRFAWMTQTPERAAKAMRSLAAEMDSGLRPADAAFAREAVVGAGILCVLADDLGKLRLLFDFVGSDPAARRLNDDILKECHAWDADSFAGRILVEAQRNRRAGIAEWLAAEDERGKLAAGVPVPSDAKAPGPLRC